MSESAPSRVPSRAGRLNRWLALALIVSALVLFGWLIWRGVRTGLYARAALDDLDRLRVVMDNPSFSALPAAQADLASLETHLVEARAAARPFLKIAPALGWSPKYGPDIAAAPQLLDMAVEVATGARLASNALMPIAKRVGGGGGALDALPAAVDTLVAGQGALAEARNHLAYAAVLRAGLPQLTSYRLSQQLQKVDKLLPLALDGLSLAQAAPGLLGADGPRTYLLLAQNSDELRATGGFISGAGHVTIDHGKLVDLVLKDSYSADNWQQPHPQPPAPLRKYMAADLWVLRDSNWSPDFPTAADVARALYAQDQGVLTDGAVALDLEAVRLLVGAVGPLQVPGIAEPVTGDNALQWMKAAWESPASGDALGPPSGEAWWVKRKDFMGELVKAALAKVQAGGDLDLVAIGRALYGALDGRHIQAAVDDGALAQVLAQRGWDGAVRPPANRDFLLVVDSNVGFNKVNLYVRSALDYRVDAVDGALQATLTATYTHTAPPNPQLVCNRQPDYGPTYDDLARRCYFDYVRVYARGGAELISSDGLASIATEPGESDTTTFTGDFTLRPGETHTIVLRYRLPPTVPARPYGLFVRKQAGTPGWPLTVQMGECKKQATLTSDVSLQCDAE